MMPYILHAALILAGCLVFYKLLLQKETFFRLNRWVLIACLVISFSLPFVQVPSQWSFRGITQPAVETTHQVTSPAHEPPDNTAPTNAGVQQSVSHQTQAAQESRIQWPTIIRWVGWLYWFGVLVFTINFIWQVVHLLYRAYTLPVIKDGRFRIVELSGDKAPCSFGNNIFINPAKYDWETYNQILLHEKEHIRQGHTLDLLVAELVLIMQWFNPFAWLYRKELESNLEFLTDDRLLHYPEVEREAYQLSLLKVTAPHLPLSITTNYNQSLLKKRVAMMNAKRSNLHTGWKYFFLLPLLVLFACLLNDPVVKAQSGTKPNPDAANRSNHRNKGIPLEGVWFAVIKNDKVTFQFKSQDEDFGMSTTTFPLSDIKDLPRDKNGIFYVTRDAGTIQFTGKFEGDQGMGKYEFKADQSYAEAMRKDGVVFDDDENQLVFFMVDIKRTYPQMLKDNGYPKFDKSDLIPLAALKVDAAYIQSLKKNGYSNIGLKDLIPLKSLGIDGAYIDEIRKAGYPNVTPHQLISFKAQGINGKYISDIKSAAGQSRDSRSDKGEKGEKGEKGDKDESQNGKVSADDLVALKALNIGEDYIREMKQVGYDNLSNHDLIAMKAQGINADYILSFKAAGYENIPAHDLIAIKAQGVTPEYLMRFAPLGYEKVSLRDAISLKALGVTPEYIKEFQNAGFKISLNDAVSMKAQSITVNLVKQYQALNLGDVSVHDVIGAKATGTTPEFISAMKQKGHDLKSIQKYIQLKTIVE